MKVVKRLDNRISHRTKMKEMLTKVPAKEGKIAKRKRRVFADQTNQQGQERLEEEVKKIPLDERTMARRSRRVLEKETNQQGADKQSSLEGKTSTQRRKGKTIESKDVEISRLENTKGECVKKDIEEDMEMMDIVTEEITEETKEMEKEKKWDPLNGLSEYEKIRLENIRQREALFAELEFADAKAAATPPRTATPSGTRTQRSVPSRRGLQMPKKEKEELLPRRQSSRLKEGVYEIQRYNPGVDSVEVKPKKIQRPMSFPTDTPRAPTKTPSRRGLQMAKGEREGWEIPLHPLSLEECGASNSSTFLASLAKPVIATSSSAKGDLSSLSINSERVAKVVPDRIFSVALHPGGEKLVAAAGDKWGKVGLWDCLDTESETHGVHLLHYHSRPVNCLTWDIHSSHRLISTSYDGTSRQLDVEKQKASLLFHDPDFLASGGWASFHCQDSVNTFLITLGNQGSVARVDTRVGVLPVATYHLLDKSHAKSISCHPLQPHLLLTGTNKGGCSIFDLRSSPGKEGLLVPATSLLGATRSLSSCQFSPSGSQVVTMASDDKLRLYNTQKLAHSLQPVVQVRHDNYTGRWLTPFRASWHPSRDDLLVTGSMERPRQVEIWRTGGDKLVLEGRLRGEELASVASLLAIHPTRNALVGGNSSGRLHLFI